MKTEKSITETVATQLEGLRSTLAAACKTLESERATLEAESQGLKATADELRDLLPAKARRAARDYDDLLLGGKIEAAQKKREEQTQAENAPAEMEQRRSAIAERIEAIDSQKRAIARHVFQEFFPGFRAALVAEQQTLCTALDNAWAGVVAFAVETGTAASQPSLLKAGLRDALTAYEHGSEKALFEKLQSWFGAPAPNVYARGTGKEAA